jgi:hypothetical protein
MEKATYFGVLAGLICCCSIVVWIFSMQIDTLKIEAVERGHAEWKIKSNGAVNWQWKELK